MDQRLKNIVLEKFESKKQQKYFFAKCNDDSLSKKEKNKWCKMADEFAKDTDFKKLPEKANEENIEEIVDFDGSIPTSKIPKDVRAKSVTARKTSDAQVAATSQPPFQKGQYMKRYWGESEMDDALGYEETMGKNASYEEALEYFMNDLGFDESDAKERLEKMGYIPSSEDKVRIIETMTKKQIEEYVDTLLKQKSMPKDILDPSIEEIEEEKEEETSNPILDRKLKFLMDLSDEDKKYIINKLK
jgi:hypothetical protein